MLCYKDYELNSAKTVEIEPEVCLIIRSLILQTDIMGALEIMSELPLDGPHQHGVFIRTILCAVGGLLVLSSLAATAYMIYRRRRQQQRLTSPLAPPRPQFIIPLFVSPRVIRSFPTRSFHPGAGLDPECCPICLYMYPEGTILSVLPKCNHSFHLECILKSFRRSTKCPICRHNYDYLSLESLADIEAPDDHFE